MELLLFALILLVVLAIVIYVVRLLPLPAPWGNVAVAIVCLIALLILVSKLGYLPG